MPFSTLEAKQRLLKNIISEFRCAGKEEINHVRNMNKEVKNLSDVLEDPEVTHESEKKQKKYMCKFTIEFKKIYLRPVIK